MGSTGLSCKALDQRIGIALAFLFDVDASARQLWMFIPDGGRKSKQNRLFGAQRQRGIHRLRSFGHDHKLGKSALFVATMD